MKKGDGARSRRRAESNETAPAAVVSETVEHAGTLSPKTGAQARRHLVAGLRFMRHLLEMLVAMIAGMALLGVALAALGEPPGYASPLVRYSLMGAFMAAPMVAWMRHRGHSWSDGLEMTLAMLVPMLALVVPVELDVARYIPGLSEASLPIFSHAAMIGGMVVLMIYRFDRYAHRVHSHRARSEEA